jgi:hypothetical protein
MITFACLGVKSRALADEVWASVRRIYAPYKI